MVRSSSLMHVSCQIIYQSFNDFKVFGMICRWCSNHSYIPAAP